MNRGMGERKELERGKKSEGRVRRREDNKRRMCERRQKEGVGLEVKGERIRSMGERKGLENGRDKGERGERNRKICVKERRGKIWRNERRETKGMRQGER